MMAPRSFLFTRQQPLQSTTSRKQRNDGSKAQRRTASPTKTASETDLSATMTEIISRPNTPPVQIPRGNREPDPRHETRKDRPHNARKHPERAERRARTIHSPDAIPPSVAALLAITSIPPQRLGSLRKRSSAGQRLTVDAILQHTHVSEKEYSLSLGKSPLDLLLSPPEELDEDETLDSETGRESFLSTRTMSSDSMPSLDGDSISEASPSLSSILTPNSRGKRSLPLRRLQQLSSPPSESGSEDPLSAPDLELDEMDFRVFDRPQESEDEKLETEIEPPRRKSAFKSNLTSSLKALRSAARSFSNLKAPMITPDDFLTRSIITIDPQVPFTDERMPPRLEDTPTPALRRYLNPITNAPIEAHIPASLTQTTSAPKCTASIQMQTYKVSRATKSRSPSVISRRTQSTSEDVFANVATGPVAKQRDMRENSDFIRIAVMEMAMRRKGKLDDQKPGRAKWALPPRRPSTKPYEIGADGTPVRWIAVTH